MRKLAQKVVVQGVATALFISGWTLIGVFALGNKLIRPIPRTKPKGDYV